MSIARDAPREILARALPFDSRLGFQRYVPVDDRYVGETARLSAPVIRQVLIEASEEISDQDEFERKLYVIRRVIERISGPGLALPSFSSRTMVYKGMLTAPQLDRKSVERLFNYGMTGFAPQLCDERDPARVMLV